MHDRLAVVPTDVEYGDLVASSMDAETHTSSAQNESERLIDLLVMPIPKDLSILSLSALMSILEDRRMKMIGSRQAISTTVSSRIYISGNMR